MSIFQIPKAAQAAATPLTPRQQFFRARAVSQGASSAPNCTAEVNIGVFFEGTNNNMKRHGQLAFLYVFCCVMATLLCACSNAESEAAKQEGTAASIVGYNYTSEGIQEFYVNGGWGGGLGIGDGGGSRVCCAMLPDKWTPELTATVEWRRSNCGGVDSNGYSKCANMDVHKWPEKSLKATVPIERFDKPGGDLQVMFLPNDEIKLYVSPLDVRRPDHPSKLGRPYPIGHPEHPDHPDYRPKKSATSFSKDSKGNP